MQEGEKKYFYLTCDFNNPALVSEDPLTIMLQFEPNGRPGEDRNYYLKNKENICVVCGTDKDCVRKNIVPHEYRRSVRSTVVMSTRS